MKAHNEKGIDRRVQKTKKYLTEALINLILEKGYENVTVQDIIDKANVGRSTFYLHYESKEQLFLDGHNNLNVHLFPDTDNAGEKHKEISFEHLFRHASENPHLAKAIFGKKSGHLMTEFYKNTIALRIREVMKGTVGNRKAEQQLVRFLADAAASAVVSLLVSWLEENTPFPADEMALRSKRIVMAIFEKLSLQNVVVIGGQD